MAAVDHTLHFRIFEREGRRVSLSVDGGTAVEAPLDLEWLEARIPKSEIGQITAGTCKIEHLHDIGTQLWESLLTGDLRSPAEAARTELIDGAAHLTLRLELPPDLEALPWEALFDMQRLQFVATHPRAALVRHPPAGLLLPGPRARAPGPLQMLVVIPEGSGLGVDYEYRRIQIALQPLAPILAGGGPRRLDGPVTADKLASELEWRAYDIVHFIGHGRVIDGAPEVRLNDDGGGERWAAGDELAQMFVAKPARLVVLNCCLGGKPDARRGFAGLGPLLLTRGVPAVVAMHYEIDDDAAIAFAGELYQGLASGSAPGSATAAVTRGRRALERNYSRRSPRSLVTPLLFLAPGVDRVVEIPASVPEISVTPKPEEVPRAPTVVLPEDLIAAMKDRNCIPVVGPGLLARLRGPSSPLVTAAPPGVAIAAFAPPAAERSAPIAPRLLAELLAGQSRYPQVDELTLGERAGDWIDLLVLARVSGAVQALRLLRRGRTGEVLRPRGGHRGGRDPGALGPHAGALRPFGHRQDVARARGRDPGAHGARADAGVRAPAGRAARRPPGAGRQGAGGGAGR